MELRHVSKSLIQNRQHFTILRELSRRFPNISDALLLYYYYTYFPLVIDIRLKYDEIGVMISHDLENNN